MSEYRETMSRATEPTFFQAPWPKGELRPQPYQQAGVEYRVQRKHGLFGDAPGLGKTCECLLTGNVLEARKTLIVCPASLRLNWEREVRMWSTLEGLSTYPVLKAKDGVSLVHDFVIVSYDSLRNDGLYDAICDGFWDHLILDEAHYLKDPNGNVRSIRTLGGVRMDKGEDGKKHRMIYDGIVSRCGHVTAATGTPMPNQPIEIYNMARLMAHEDALDGMEVDDFREFYYSEGWGYVTGWHEVQTPDGVVNKMCRHKAKVRNVPRNLDILQSKLRSTFMVRRLKEDVLTQLPPKEWHMLPVEKDAKVRKAMKSEGWLKAERLHDVDPKSFNEAALIDGAIATARREVGEALAPQALSYCKELLEEGVEKLVVSAWHRSVLEVLNGGLAKYGCGFIDGSVAVGERQDAVDRFQDDPNCRVILGQQLSMGVGWTLTAAHHVVFAEWDWVPGNNDQMLDRVHRYGQEASHVLGHVLYVPDSLHEKIMSRAFEKAKNIHLALDKA